MTVHAKFIIVAITIMIVGLRAQAQPTIKQFLADRILVKADVTEIVSSDRGMITTRQVITTIYCGTVPGDVRSFVITSGELPGGGAISGGGSSHICPALSIGEEALWLLRATDSGLVPSNDNRYQIGWPARHIASCTATGGSILGPAKQPAANARYRAIVEMAGAAADVWRKPDEEARLGLLKVYARSQTPEVARWAIIVLSDTYPETIIELARDSSRSGLSLEVLITLDEITCNLDLPADEWRDHQNRADLLARLTDAARAGEVDAQAVLTRLSMAIQERQINPELFLRLVTPFIDDEALQMKTRTLALGMLRYVVNDTKVGHDVVDRLITALERGLDDPLAGHALHALTPVERLSPEQVARVVTVRDAAQTASAQATDKHAPIHEVAKTLAEIVRRATSKRVQ